MSYSIESLGEPTPRPTRKPPSRSSTPQEHNSIRSFWKHLRHALSDIAGVSNLHLAGGAAGRDMNVTRPSHRPTMTEEDWDLEARSRAEEAWSGWVRKGVGGGGGGDDDDDDEFGGFTTRGNGRSGNKSRLGIPAWRNRGVVWSASGCDRDLSLCDDDHDDLYEDLQQPFTRNLFNSIFFQSTNQAKARSNVSRDSCSDAHHRLSFPFLTNNPCTDLRPFLRSYSYPIPIVHAVKVLRSFMPFKGPYYRLPPFEGHIHLSRVHCIRHAVHTRYILILF